jgi:RNA polymerase sigma factor (TIGR02999 family)
VSDARTAGRPDDPSHDGARGREGVDEFVPLVYDQLRRLARRHLRGERAEHTLTTTALVHEAYVKLAVLDRLSWKSPSHFLAVASQAMRRILVDYAVARKTHKRGGLRQQVPLTEGIGAASERPVEQLLAIEGALQTLEQLNPRLVRIVECRFFGGMNIEETARALDLSPATVKRDWALARAWLGRALRSSAS